MDEQLDQSNPWAPDADIGARADRLKREREERCARGSHEDPDHSGMCINCSAFLDAERRTDGR